MRTGKLFGMAVIVAAGVGGFFLTTGAASANGCNGVISPAEWGCAPWDHNNGPQYPHYQRSAAAPSNNGGSQNRQPYSQPYSGNNGRIITQDGASLIGHDGSSMRQH